MESEPAAVPRSWIHPRRSAFPPAPDPELKPQHTLIVRPGRCRGVRTGVVLGLLVLLPSLAASSAHAFDLTAQALPAAASGSAAEAAASSTPIRRAATWADIDNLRGLLMASGTRVVQSDCNQPGLQGLYHDNSDTIVICRVHRDPQAVWNTLAHEATHRMQTCAGGSITNPAHHQAMARALATYAPDEWRSLRSYPADQQLGELEARYTARLAPEQVPRLYRRYCGKASSAALGPSGRIPSFLSTRP